MGGQVNLTRLKKASKLEFQRLEFLGDAVIEVYTLLMAKRVLNHLEIKHLPENMHNFKALLLSCFGLTLFGISLDLAVSFEGEESPLVSEMSELAENLKLFESSLTLRLCVTQRIAEWDALQRTQVEKSEGPEEADE